MSIKNFWNRPWQIDLIFWVNIACWQLTNKFTDALEQISLWLNLANGISGQLFHLSDSIIIGLVNFKETIVNVFVNLWNADHQRSSPFGSKSLVSIWFWGGLSLKSNQDIIYGWQDHKWPPQKLLVYIAQHEVQYVYNSSYNIEHGCQH